ncbi:MAG TPA: cation transporter, partial [Terriglobia bacterium]|nr:cation transporter [Terriglobia bacterium]
MKNILSWLLLLVPVAIVLELVEVDPLYIFIASAIAIIPLAGWMGRATEWITEHLGPGVGGLLNATFGNAAELIIAIMALRAGLHDVVKASITGSIIGNILLVLGFSIVMGGAKHAVLRFNRTAASLSATLLALSAVALIMPALFHALSLGAGQIPAERSLSVEISIVLAATYVLSLVFSLYTHKHLYVGPPSEGSEHALGMAHVPLWRATAIL